MPSAAPRPPLVDRLQAIVDRPTGFEDRLQAAADAYLADAEALTSDRDALRPVFLELVAHGQTDGHLRAGDPRPLALTLWSALHGLATLTASGPAPPLAPATLVTLLLSGLARPGAPDVPRAPPRAQAALAVVRRADGRYLLIRRAAPRPGGGFWAPITGRPMAGESLAAAAAREVREEVGLRVRIGRELGRGTTADGDYALTWFDAALVDPDDTPPTLDPAEVDAAVWCTPTEALALRPLFPATRAFFARLAAGAAPFPRDDAPPP